jgi:hypothetical protein
MADQSTTMEIGSHLLNQLDASKPGIRELDEAALEDIAGGGALDAAGAIIAKHPFVSVGTALGVGGVIGAGIGYAVANGQSGDGGDYHHKKKKS